MKKVSTKNKMKGLFGLFAIFTMAIGVGVSLAPKTSSKLLADEQYSKSYTKANMASLLSGSYSDESSYWKVPASANNSATLTIPIVDGPLYPTTNITITLSVATYGSGTVPSSSNTTIKAVGNEAGSSWTSSSVSGTYPSSSTYTTLTLTMTKPASSLEIGTIKLTIGVNTGVRVLRFQTMTVSFTHGTEDRKSVV